MLYNLHSNFKPAEFNKLAGYSLKDVKVNLVFFIKEIINKKFLKGSIDYFPN